MESAFESEHKYQRKEHAEAQWEQYGSELAAFEKQIAHDILVEITEACGITVMEISQLQSLHKSATDKIVRVRYAALEEAIKVAKDAETFGDAIRAIAELKEQK